MMDTSPEYIKMCEMADEIQAMRTPKDKQELADGYIAHFNFEKGDFFSIGELFSSGNYLIHTLGSITNKPYIYHRHGIETLELPDREIHDRSDTIKKIVWLPRLDQLLEILCDDGKTTGFSGWVINSVNFRHAEQMYLEDVMQTKFGKKWDGEKWIATK